MNISKSGIITSGGLVNKNLVTDSYVNTTSDVYGYSYRSFIVTKDVSYILSARGYISNAAKTSNTVLKVYFYKPGWEYSAAILTFDSVTPTTKYAGFKATETTTINIASYSFKAASTAGDPVTTIWYKAEEGNAPTAWVPNSADSIYIGEYIGFSEECITPKIASFVKSGQITATEFIEI